jgi:hypothetical protein
MTPYFLAPEILKTLATSQAVAFLRDKFHPPQDYPVQINPDTFAVANPGQALPTGPFYPMPSNAPLLPSQAQSTVQPYSYNDTTDYTAMTINFLLIGHCIWALIVAALGGILARFAAGRAPSS